MNITEALDWRYSTKEFDPTKKISDKDFQTIKDLLRKSPSSTNLQPWHFVIASTEEGKNRVAKATEGFYQFNKAKVVNASHVVVFCTKIDADPEHMAKVLEKEDQDGRFATTEHKDGMNNGRNMFANIHRYDLKDMTHWLEKQVYLNMGSLLLGAGLMEIDAVPMEGIDAKALDEEFNLREKGFTAFAVVSLGYRADSDFNAKLPKSRLAEEEIITEI